MNHNQNNQRTQSHPQINDLEDDNIFNNGQLREFIDNLLIQKI